jgi:hypothetical protein
MSAWVEEARPMLTKKYAGMEQYLTGYAFGQDFPIGLR